MTITQQPSALNLSGNLPDIVATAVVAPVSFELYKGSELILSENYQPSAEQTIRIRLKDMISQLLEVEVPPFDDEIFHQSKSYASFTAEVGAETISFKVVKGGVDLPSPDAPVFLAGNFLTWQPQEKKVKYHDPEWLTYYAASASTIRVRAYFQGSSTQTITLATLPAGQVASINMNYGHIRGKFAQQPLYFDVWAEVSSVRKSFIQRYIFDVSCDDYDDLFVFENTLGGIDNIRFTGQRTRIDSFDTESALFDENTNEYFSEADRSTEKNTGYFPNERLRIWALEFFASYQRYHLDDGVLKRILVAKPELSAERHRLADYVFVFQPSHQTRFMNLPRQDSLPENLNIIGPGDEVFFLAPRLNEFAGASDLANALFPVQLAFEDEWRKVTFNELVQAVTDAGGGPPIMTLAGLNDTAISNPQEDDGLFYNPATQKWHNKPFSFNPSDYLTQTTADGRYVTQATDQLSLPGNKGWTGRHHFTGSLSIPQAAPATPQTGQSYIWFGNPGSGSTPPPAYGNLEDLQNVADVIDDGKYLRKVGGQWVGVDISFPDLSGYATQSWVNAQGFIKAPDLSAYATQAWAAGQFVTQATDQLSLPGNKGWTGRHHFTGALSIPQAAPATPQTGQSYIWFGSPGGGSTPPPTYGNLEDLQNVANVIDNGKYLRKVGGEWVGVDISFPDLSGYATQSWVNAQGFIKAPDLSAYATQAWATGQFVTQATDQLSLPGNKGWTGRHHFTGALAIPQTEPVAPVAGQSYIWFGNPGGGSTPPPAYGNLEDLQNVADSIDNGKYLRKVGGEWTGVDITFPDLSGYATQSWVTAGFAPISHTHTIAQVTGLQSALDGKEAAFTKNTAFNKNFGTSAGTVAQGNDSRIINGQTAFGWGDYRPFGLGVTGGTSASWPNSIVDLDETITANGLYYFAPSATGNPTGTSNSGSVIIQRAVSDYYTQLAQPISNGTSAASVRLFARHRTVSSWTPWVQFWHDGNLNPSDFGTLAGSNTWTGHNHFTSALSIPQSAPTGAHAGQAYVWFGTPGSGSGGGTSGTLAGLDDVALSSLANNQLIRYNSSTGTWVNFTASYAPASHTHPISQITGLQAALDGKEPAFSKNTAFNKNFGTTSGTVAQGNDSRILNGQTAFGWGDFRPFGLGVTGSTSASWPNSVADLDDTDTPNGMYYFGTTAIGNPTGTDNSGSVIIQRATNGYYTQLAQPIHAGTSAGDVRLFARHRTTAAWTPWVQFWHSGNLANGTTSQYIRGNGSLATFPTIGTGTLSLSTGTGLQGSASFGANQTGNTSFTVSAASGYAIPTTAQIGNWNAAYSYSQIGHLPLVGGALTTTEATPLRLVRSGTTAQVNIGFQHTGTTAYLGVDLNGTLRFGTNENTISNNYIWHSGNFNPANYGLLAGDNIWSGLNAFDPPSTIMAHAPGRISFYGNALGSLIRGSNQSSTDAFFLRTYGIDGVQLNLNEGGVSIPPGAPNTTGLFFGSNLVLRHNSTRQTFLAGYQSGSAASIYLRPQGESSSDGQVLIYSNGKITCPVIEPTAFIVPATAPSSPESGKRYLWVS